MQKKSIGGMEIGDLLYKHRKVWRYSYQTAKHWFLRRGRCKVGESSEWKEREKKEIRRLSMGI